MLHKFNGSSTEPAALPTPRKVEPDPDVHGPRRKQVAAAVPTSDPHDIEAERGVLGSILLDPPACLPIIERIAKGQSGLFYELKHQVIWDHILALNALGAPIDSVTVSRSLRDRQQLDIIGGLPYLAELQDASPSAANLTYYLGICQDQADKRELIRELAAAHNRLKAGKTEAADELAILSQKVEAIRERGKRTGLPEIGTVGDLCMAEIHKPEELIEGVLHRGSKLVIGGASKGAKTWSLMGIALAVASGADWLGRHTVQGRVLYVNFEIQEYFFRQRIQQIARCWNIELPYCPLDPWNLRGHDAPIEKIAPMIERKAKRMADAGTPYALIIVDPIYKALGNRDENKAADIANLLNHLERIAFETGAAIAFAAHFAKGNSAGKDSIDRMSGSGVFGRDPDAIGSLTRHEEEGCDVLEWTLRNFPPAAPIVVEWRCPVHVLRPDLDPALIKEAKPKKSRSKGDSEAVRAPEHEAPGRPQVLDELRPVLPMFLASWGRDEGLSMRAAAKKLSGWAELNGRSVSEKTSRNMVEQLIAEGLLSHDDDNETNQLLVHV